MNLMWSERCQERRNKDAGTRKRIAALLLSAAMMLQAGGVTALAAEGGLPTGAGGVEACTHHTHDDACGYT